MLLDVIFHRNQVDFTHQTIFKAISLYYTPISTGNSRPDIQGHCMDTMWLQNFKGAQQFQGLKIDTLYIDNANLYTTIYGKTL